MFSFYDKVVWVTGSSTGIGRAISLGFAEQGCNVVAHYNSSEKEAREVIEQIQKMGRKALLVQGDVAKPQEVGRMVGEIDEHFGRLDVLVNNAGSLVERASLEEITEKLWDRVMDVNLKSVLLCSQAVLPMMKRQGGGKIINVSSVAARNGGGPGSAAYATAKAGVGNLTRSMAKELVSDGILVNAVAPGVISTPFHDRFTSDEARKGMVDSIPIGREGRPDEIVGAMLFLASSWSDYIAGEIIEVNGGQLMD